MPQSRTFRPRVGWLRQAGGSMAVWWPAKLVGTSGGMTVFFAAYFWVLHHPQFPVSTMPLTVVDGWIGFEPAALPLYLSLWFYVSLAPALAVDRRELLSGGVAWVVLSVTGLGLFLLWPTAVPAPAIDWARYPSVAWLKSADATGNACPSLHVAFAVFSAGWIGRRLRHLQAGWPGRWLNGLWCAGILYSTVATRQHVALDVLAGGVLGGLGAVAHRRWLRRGAGGSVRELVRTGDDAAVA